MDDQLKVEKPKVEKPKVEKPKISEKEYIIVYKRIGELELMKLFNAKMFKGSAELEGLKAKAALYKDGAYGVKCQTLGIATERIFLSPDYMLPKTYVDKLLSNKRIKAKQYIKI